LRLLSNTPENLTSVLRGRYQPAVQNRVAFHAAAARLHASLVSRTGEPAAPVETWKMFAPGLTEESIAGALEFGLRRRSEDVLSQKASSHAAYPELGVEAHWLQSIAATLPLTPFTMASHRLRLLQSGARHFRFRSTTARVFCCALRPQEGAVCEDGTRLARAQDLNHVVPGSYSICRDEVHFRPTDDSDPRTNGRNYTVLVPPPVAYVESLPLHEINL
jgi:hypothetical protein